MIQTQGLIICTGQGRQAASCSFANANKVAAFVAAGKHARTHGTHAPRRLAGSGFVDTSKRPRDSLRRRAQARQGKAGKRHRLYGVQRVRAGGGEHRLSTMRVSARVLCGGGTLHSAVAAEWRTPEQHTRAHTRARTPS